MLRFVTRLNQSLVIPLGIEDVSRIETSSKSVEQVECLCNNDFVLFVGVLRYYKGLDILLDAADKVNCDIVIAGSGALEGKLKAKGRETQFV